MGGSVGGVLRCLDLIIATAMIAIIKIPPIMQEIRIGILTLPEFVPVMVSVSSTVIISVLFPRNDSGAAAWLIEISAPFT